MDIWILIIYVVWAYPISYFQGQRGTWQEILWSIHKSEFYETADCGEEMLSGNTWKIAMRVIFYIRLV